MPHRHHTPELLARNADIKRRREAGAGPRQIAREMSLSPNVIAGVLHRCGMTDPVIHTGGRQTTYSAETMKAVVDMYWKTTAKQAAKAFGVHYKSVLKWARSA